MKLQFLTILLVTLLSTGCGQPTPTANKSAILNSPEDKAKRIARIEENKDQFARDGITISLENKNKDTLKLKSTSVSNEEMRKRLRSSVKSFDNIGISTIVISDSSNEVRAMDFDSLKEDDNP